ncbi:hypothetical protein K491DRAFT_689913 [Lophiostoma macrostomum CBS 122681]|uniref:Uncharacterized protein n=1 Tax=Lophiostoma macrostomum CBS 122681 TaxID=1314788 RepID=A0A6A6TF39_9PLEO|nr:hypothetical protein K491DRAFT_689913 [Lophiostoma macrostomum CBS 122681]
MAEFNIDTLEARISSLQSQLEFFASALDDTNSEDPEWLATDLISLKGKTSMLVDEMRRVRKRMVGEGVRGSGAENDGGGSRRKRARLSIEGPGEESNGVRTGGLNGRKKDANGQEEVKAQKAENPSTARFAPGVHPRPTKQDKESSSTSSNPTSNDIPPATPTPDADVESEAGEYQVQYVDVTEEVNRRLRESRLRQLMDSPSTAKKRKLDAFEPPEDNGGDVEADGSDWSERYKSPTKKIRSSGQFEQMVKLNEGVKRGDGDGQEGEEEGRGAFKRRRV